MRDHADGNLPLLLDAVSLRVGATTILDRVSATIGAGTPLLVVGPNGSGKSTLLRIAMGLTVPTSGRVTWGHAGQADRRAMVFQRPVMLRRSAAANVAYGLAPGAGDRRARAARVEALLDRVGLLPLADRPARSLSGGEQQRLALARALARDPEILFLDEPTASLDPAATRLVEEIVESAARDGIKIVMASHDLGQMRRLAGEILFLVRGRLHERAPVADFFAHPATPEAAAFLRGDLIL